MALPLSLGSMLVTQGLISKGIFSASPRFGPYPKMARCHTWENARKSFRKLVLHHLVHNKKGSVIILAKTVNQNWDQMREKVQALQQLSARGSGMFSEKSPRSSMFHIESKVALT